LAIIEQQRKEALKEQQRQEELMTNKDTENILLPDTSVINKGIRDVKTIRINKSFF
jgi:hypothetical protein